MKAWKWVPSMALETQEVKPELELFLSHHLMPSVGLCRQGAFPDDKQMSYSWINQFCWTKTNSFPKFCFYCISYMNMCMKVCKWEQGWYAKWRLVTQLWCGQSIVQRKRMLGDKIDKGCIMSWSEATVRRLDFILNLLEATELCSLVLFWIVCEE